MYSAGMGRPRILVTCWRRPLPTYLGERTVLDTLDPAYAARVFDAGGLPLVVSRPPPTGVSGPPPTGKFQHYDPASRLEHDSASCRGAIVRYRRAGGGMLEIAPPEGL